jgi:hypothetical protein
LKVRVFPAAPLSPSGLSKKNHFAVFWVWQFFRHFSAPGSPCMKAAIPTIRFAQRLTNSILRGGGEAADRPLYLVVLNGLQSLHIGVALLARQPAIVTRN